MVEEQTMTPSNSQNAEPAALPGSLDLVMDLELPVMVRFGRRRMRLGELASLVQGCVVDFERASENEVDVVVNDRVVARGEAVVVEGSFGVRITQVFPSSGRAATDAEG
jgi:flagellar motor switch protein FliN/FliY